MAVCSQEFASLFRFSFHPPGRCLGRLGLATCLWAGALCMEVQATDWIVNPGGSIQAAIVGATDGDRVLVQPGTYWEVMDLLGKQLEIIGVGGADFTVIDGTGFNDTIFKLISGEPTGTVIRGFTLTGGAGRPLPSSFGFDYYGGAIHVNGGSQLQVAGCLIVDNARGTGTFAGGIYSGGRSTSGVPSHVDVIACEISDNEAWASGGATLADWYGTMSFDRCTVVNNRSNNFFGQQGGISMANYGQVWVQNSIVWANQGTEIGAFGYPYNKGTKATVRYTDVDGGFAGTANMNLDPQFVNPGAGNYTLQATSPCIDAGDPATPPDCDGTVVDMGAHGPACTVDCNGNGIPDSVDILNGTSTDCDANGIPDECDVASDDSNDWNGDGIHDACASANYCTATPNQTGLPAVIGLLGSPSVSANSFTMVATQMPVGEMGYFVMSQSSGFIPNVGGSAGNLCLGIPFYRFNRPPAGQVLNSGATGSFSFTADLMNLPGAMAFNPGASWYFQAWFRDSAGGTSNFTDGIEVMFR